MFRLLRAIWRKFAGMLGVQSNALEEDVDVISATYDNSIKGTTQRFAQLRDAVGLLINEEEKKKEILKAKTAEIDRIAKLKAGATVLAKKRVEQLTAEGKTKEQIASDSEIIKHSSVFEKYNSDLNRLTNDSKDLEEKLQDISRKTASHKANLEMMLRQQNDLKAEKAEAVADVVSAKEMNKINELLAGISTDTSDNDLQAARDARRRVNSRAAISAELSGIGQSTDAQYEQAAMAATSGGEFAALIGLEEKADKSGLDPAKLPES